MRSAPVLTPWHHEMKQSVKGRVKEQVLGRTGASWEDRLQEQKAKKVQAMKTIEKEQREAIKAATEKGIEKQQVYSPLLALRSAPLASFAEKQAQRQEERVKDMEDKVRSYHITRGQILEKMRTREPLFRTEDVSAAKTALAEARRKRQAELQAEEKKRWEHLEECAAKGCQKRQTLYDLHNSPSFDARLARAVERKTQELRDLEKAQKDRIRDAVEAGHVKSAAVSPLSACLRNPPDNAERQQEILEERKRAMASIAAEYFRKRDEMLTKQANREPLFSNDLVADAAAALEGKAHKLKQEMAAEQLKQRQHIQELQNKVLSRPLMMERNYGIAA